MILLRETGIPFFRGIPVEPNTGGPDFAGDIEGAVAIERVAPFIESELTLGNFQIAGFLFAGFLPCQRVADFISSIHPFIFAPEQLDVPGDP